MKFKIKTFCFLSVFVFFFLFKMATDVIAAEKWYSCADSAITAGYCTTTMYAPPSSITCSSTVFSSKDTCEGKPGTPSAASAGASTDKKEPGVVELDNPLKLGKTVPAILGAIIKGALGIMGGLVLLMVVWGGTTWITAAGNPEKVKAGSQTILWALLGGILTVASYIILNNIVNQFF